MTRFLPQSLFGQTLLILLAGLVISHLIGAWIYTSDREYAVRAIGGMAMAQRVANLTRLVEEAPPDWRERIVAAVNDPTFQVALTPLEPALAGGSEQSPAAQIIRDFLADRLSERTVRQVRVAVSPTAGAPVKRMHDHRMPMRPMMHAAGAWRGLQVAVQLADAEWLTFGTALPDAGPVSTPVRKCIGGPE